jgi:hypothetical protein
MQEQSPAKYQDSSRTRPAKAVSEEQARHLLKEIPPSA